MKKLFAALLTVICMGSSCVFAQGSEYASLPNWSVTFNGREVDSSSRKYPLLQFRNITYFPMTYDDCRFLGLTTQWDDSARKLTITKETVQNAAYNDYEYLPNKEKFEYGKIGAEVTDCEFQIEVNGQKFDNSREEHPLLLFAM